MNKQNIQFELFPIPEVHAEDYGAVVGVHVRHCCVIHGCKYGEKDCPVATKRVPQESGCFVCWEETHERDPWT